VTWAIAVTESPCRCSSISSSTLQVGPPTPPPHPRSVASNSAPPARPRSAQAGKAARRPSQGIFNAHNRGELRSSRRCGTAWVLLSRMKHTGVEEAKAGAAIHRPLQHFEAADLAFATGLVVHGASARPLRQ
jgi:hypothetical protein